MEIITNPSEMVDCALALGNFDGLHVAHIEIIKSCREYAKANNLKSGVLLFENHTETVLGNSDIKLITTYREKIDIIKQLGVDFVYVKRFDEETMKIEPDAFFCFLTDDLKAKALFAGYDYKFGYKAKGNINLLCELGKENNVHISICDKIEIDGIPLSSTKIRELVKNGEISKANRYLGRCYEISGRVVGGKQNGRKMGLPTANVEYQENKLIPPDGVYSGFVRIGNESYRSLINIGKNPTFNAEARTVESHILDFDKNIYNEYITVCFEDKIRDEVKFNSVDELKKQIECDLEKVRKESK